jgi:2-methylcitrate dehydratase PrpD
VAATVSSTGAAADASFELAALVSGTSAVPASAIAAARLDLLDTLACAIAGRGALGVAAAERLLLAQGGAAQAAVWGSGRRLPAAQAAFLNAMAGHALDYDDMHPGVAHTGVCVIPAALAAAQREGSDDLADLLLAVVLATEVADRIAVAVQDGPGVTGWLLTPLCGYFGAAAAAARVQGLDTTATQHALGFAYVQASGNGQSTLDGALAKRMQPGFAARGGVFAAELAEAGLTAPTAGLEGPRGFYTVYHRGRYHPEALRGDGGWLIERATFKPYPCCGWTHAALECAAALAASGVAPEDIASVEVGVNGQAYRSVGTPLERRYRPQTAVDAQFSIPYTFAVSFLHGGVTLSDFDDAALRREDVLELAARVRVRVDEQLDADHARDLSPARARVTLRDGTTAQAEVMTPAGTDERPLHVDDLRRKLDLCRHAAGRSATWADELAAVVLDGTGPGSLPALCALLEATV